jgi:YjbR
VTADEFRHIALSLPEAEEQEHMNHPDFRVRGKIFATFPSRDERTAMVKLTPTQQALFIHAEPAAFAPVKGGWGRRGATTICFEAADETVVRSALITAYSNMAPKALVVELNNIN